MLKNFYKTLKERKKYEKDKKYPLKKVGVMKRLVTCLEELQRWLLSGKTYLKGHMVMVFDAHMQDPTSFQQPALSS